MKLTSAIAAILLLLMPACQAQQQEPHEHTNALINESSPYLLQHAHNPVNWHPWGEETLEKARRENKMLIISIGYAACHWCHVMERESFEDTTVARIMNEHFVAVKVDREERPDVDAVYMSACQLASKQGCGWPLNAFALPDGQPVWAGTYAPKKEWIEILQYFVRLYQEDREKLEDYAQLLTRNIRQSTLPAPLQQAEPFSRDELAGIVRSFYPQIDFQRGGRQGAPKFPVPTTYEFLLHYARLSGDEKALQAVTTTLNNMAGGGIYDQLGGGFARYATDAVWKVPHFEKMLYDNAQLVSLYSKAYQATQNPGYKKVVAESLAFIAREMTAPEGGFYSSLDADSEGEEGKFYTWQKQEIDSVLGDEKQSAVFCNYYSVEAGGNWEQRNILYRNEDEKKILTEYDLTLDELNIMLDEARQKLFEARKKRVRPALDDKVLCSWNALMLLGYLDAYRAFGEPAYREAALKNGHFILEEFLEESGRLNRNYKDGRASVNAFLDDYAFTIKAFTGLYEATFDERWLARARQLTEEVFENFQAEDSPLFYYTSQQDPPLVARKMEIQDNVIPSSNSAMARALLHLGTLLYEPGYLNRADSMLMSLRPELVDSRYPLSYANWCSLYAERAYPFYELAVVGPQAGRMRAAMQEKYLPNLLFLGGEEEGELELLQGKLQEGKTFFYVCLDKTCRLPVTTVEDALKQVVWQ